MVIIMRQETSVFTVRLPMEMQNKLDHIAERMDRSRSWLVSQATADFIEEQEMFFAAVQQGLDDAKRGNFAGDAEVEALFKKYKA